MNNQKSFLILNTGGTFGKYYDDKTGKLVVSSSNTHIKDILSKSLRNNKKPKIKGIIYKDSLDITTKDRKKLVDKINSSNKSKIIIIHGTDTMDITAKYLDKHINNRQIVLVGAMKPYSIESVEATANLMLAYGFLLANNENNIYVSIHGLVEKFNNIYKNKEKGYFSVCS